MQLKLRLMSDGDIDDVLVTADPRSTVGELAAALFPRADLPPAHSGGSGLVIDPDSPKRRTVDAATTVDHSGLRSGCSVGPGTSGSISGSSVAVATLRVHDGPDAPRTVSVHAGRSTIGRAADCDIRLVDPLVSKRHAEISVGDHVEIVDAASANGVIMSGRTVRRAVLRPGDRVELGATTLSIALHHDAIRPDAHDNEVRFNRSPRLDPRYEGIELQAPEPPAPPAAQRFPIATVVAPVALAAILFAVTQNVLSILFFALSPILMIGTWWENRAANRRQVVVESARFRSALDDLAAQLEYARGLERAGRRREHPSVVELLEAVDALAPLVWTRRPEHESFGQVRLGLGRQVSRNSVEMPSSGPAMPGLREELVEVVGRFAVVDDVPVVADLAACGNVGVAGPPAVAEPVLRGVLVQIVALHSPAELDLVGFASDQRWDWVTWLPHTDGTRLASNAAECAALVAWLEELVDRRAAERRDDAGAAPSPAVVVVVDDDAAVERARLVQVAERGPDVAVHVVWCAASIERLPAACRTFLEVDENTGRGRAGFVRSGHAVPELSIEPAGRAAAARLARRLSPVVDSGAFVDTSAELPRAIALVDLTGDELATSPDAIVDRWGENESLPAESAPRRDHGLRALVGQAADGPLYLDLRTEGPHALVGGTTGSGKSEFLQSWILAMAADHSPARVTFLLVDYKGGAAFAECVDLPHCVGLVTDLRPHLVRRALTSLDAELRHREELLHERRAKDLVELERRGDPACPPSLVIVVDEFAALVNDVPEFVDGVVNVAQRGRSLGLHLVLATQRPAGVITDNLRANTNLRIALRMADEADSDDVIGTGRAALFDPDVPGRAIARSGPGRVTAFQAAYSGGHVAGRARRLPIEVATLRFGDPVPRPPAAGPGPPVVESVETGPSDIERIVQTIDRANGALGVPAPRPPWLPDLAPRYRLEALPTDRTDDRIVFGVVDEPHRQRQSVVSFQPDVDGNMAVYGTGGTGKSGALRSLGLAAGFGSARGGPVWVYGIDFGSRGLRPLTALPHVGSVISGDDGERIQRLLRFLKGVIDDRAERFGAAEAATIGEYRRLTGRADEARVLVLVDGVGAFRTEYEGGPLHRWWDLFLTVAAEGRGLGVHVVLSCDRPSAVPSNLASSVQRQIVLRLANDLDYSMVDVPADALGPGTPPGRGFLGDRQVQIAVVGGTGDLAEQGAALERCAESMRRHGVLPAPAIESLPARVALTDLRPELGFPVIGIGDDTLAAVGFEPAGTFLVAGGPRSGRSTAVATMVRSIVASRPDTDFVLFGRRRSPLTSVVGWSATAHGTTEIGLLAGRLAERIGEAAGRSIVIVVESIGDLLDTEADVPLQDLFRAGREQGVFLIAEGETSTVGGSWPLLQAVKSSRCGLVLQPDQMDGDGLFKTPFPRTTRQEYPPGRGLMVQGGRVCKVQVALPE